MGDKCGVRTVDVGNNQIPTDLHQCTEHDGLVGSTTQ